MSSRTGSTGHQAGSSSDSLCSRLGFGAGPSAFLVSLFTTFLFVSCATKPLVTDLMVPFTQLKTIIVSTMPTGLRSESLNGRELLSNYFAPNNFHLDATEKPQRAYAKVTILGAGRPYSLGIQVYREQKMKGSNRYKSLGTDKKLAQDLARLFKEALADRREDRNVIDDFRAF